MLIGSGILINWFWQQQQNRFTNFKYRLSILIHLLWRLCFVYTIECWQRPQDHSPNAERMREFVWSSTASKHCGNVTLNVAGWAVVASQVSAKFIPSPLSVNVFPGRSTAGLHTMQRIKQTDGGTAADVQVRQDPHPPTTAQLTSLDRHQHFSLPSLLSSKMNGPTNPSPSVHQSPGHPALQEDLLLPLHTSTEWVRGYETMNFAVLLMWWLAIEVSENE